MKSLKGRRERTTILAMSRLLGVFVQIRDGDTPEQLTVGIESASAAIEILRGLYQRDHSDRGTAYAATGFDIDDAEERDPS